MQQIDKDYQKIVDAEALKYLKIQASAIVSMPAFGRFSAVLNGKNLGEGNWWHYDFGDGIHHLVFLKERPFLLCFRKKYLSGVRVINGKVELLTEKEVAQYD